MAKLTAFFFWGLDLEEWKPTIKKIFEIYILEETK
jgi:hypothetical protein